MNGLNITAARAHEIADTIDAYDEQIKALQEGKRETFEAVRNELEDLKIGGPAVRLEMAALKAAIVKRAKRRKDSDAVEERDALTDSYLDLIEGPAPRATHAIASIVPTYPERVSRPVRDLETSKDSQARLISAPAGNGADQLVTDDTLSEIVTTTVSSSVQSEAEAGSNPGEGAAAETGCGDEGSSTVDAAQFVMPSGAGEGPASPADPAPVADATTFKLPIAKPLRPHCKKPDRCGSYGHRHCAACLAETNSEAA